MRLLPAIIHFTKLLLGAICSLLIGLLILGVLVFIFGMLQNSFWEKDSALLDVASDLNSGNGSEDLLQSLPALNKALAGQVAPAIPKQINQDINDRRSWTILPFLK